MTITSVSLEHAEFKQGVVFWWSNILRGYQLRFYPPAESSAALPAELARMALIYLSRPQVEADAITLAKHFGVAIYEIEVPRLSGAPNETNFNENYPNADAIRFESIDTLNDDG